MSLEKIVPEIFLVAGGGQAELMDWSWPCGRAWRVKGLGGIGGGLGTCLLIKASVGIGKNAAT